MIVADITNKLIQRTIDDGGKVYAFSKTEKYEVISALNNRITLKADSDVFKVGDKISFLYEPLFKSPFIEYVDTDNDGIIDIHDLDADGDGVWDERLPQAPAFHYVNVIFVPSSPDQVVIDISPAKSDLVRCREWGKALIVDRHYPLYITQEEALLASPLAQPDAHSHVLDGREYWMPEGVDQWHGNYHTCMPDEPSNISINAVETYDFEYVDRALVDNFFSSIVPRNYEDRVLGVDVDEDGDFDQVENYRLIRRWNIDTYTDAAGVEYAGDPKYDHFQTYPEQSWTFKAFNVTESEIALEEGHSFYLGNMVYDIAITEKYDYRSEDNLKHTASVLLYFETLLNGREANLDSNRAAYGIRKDGLNIADFTILEVDAENVRIVLPDAVLPLNEVFYITSQNIPSVVNRVFAEIITEGNAPSEVQAISDDVSSPNIIFARPLVTPLAPSNVSNSGILAPSDIHILFPPYKPLIDEDHTGILPAEVSNVTNQHTLPAAPQLLVDHEAGGFRFGTGVLPNRPTMWGRPSHYVLSLDNYFEPEFHPYCVKQFVGLLSAEDEFSARNDFMGFHFDMHNRRFGAGNDGYQRLIQGWSTNFRGMNMVDWYEDDSNPNFRRTAAGFSVFQDDSDFAPNMDIQEEHVQFDDAGLSGRLHYLSPSTYENGYLSMVVLLSYQSTENPIISLSTDHAYLNVTQLGDEIIMRVRDEDGEHEVRSSVALNRFIQLGFLWQYELAETQTHFGKTITRDQEIYENEGVSPKGYIKLFRDGKLLGRTDGLGKMPSQEYARPRIGLGQVVSNMGWEQDEAPSYNRYIEDSISEVEDGDLIKYKIDVGSNVVGDVVEYGDSIGLANRGTNWEKLSPSSLESDRVTTALVDVAVGDEVFIYKDPSSTIADRSIGYVVSIDGDSYVIQDYASTSRATFNNSIYSQQRSVAWQRIGIPVAEEFGSFYVRAVMLHVYAHKAEGEYFATDMRALFDDVEYKGGELDKGRVWSGGGLGKNKGLAEGVAAQQWYMAGKFQSGIDALNWGTFNGGLTTNAIGSTPGYLHPYTTNQEAPSSCLHRDPPIHKCECISVSSACQSIIGEVCAVFDLDENGAVDTTSVRSARFKGQHNNNGSTGTSWSGEPPIEIGGTINVSGGVAYAHIPTGGGAYNDGDSSAMVSAPIIGREETNNPDVDQILEDPNPDPWLMIRSAALLAMERQLQRCDIIGGPEGDPEDPYYGKARRKMGITACL